MATIHDYLQWRGDLSFAERPFNDVDNIVLSTLAYLNFTGVVPSERHGGSVGLAQACRELLGRSGGDVTPHVCSLAKVDTHLVELLAESRRFGSATLGAYVDIMDDSRALQFSALRIDLPDAGSYVAFRGTDSTLVGWREDFMLSFQVTEAQREAARYLERVLTQLGERDVPVRVGGHSKGGNLAEYAAVVCPDALRERIVRVYTNDGPGMAPDVTNVDSRTVLGGRLVRIVPGYSVVGMLFARSDDPRTIVASDALGIGQHDLITWQVRRSGVEEAQELQADCVVLNEAIAAWAKDLPLNERAHVVGTVFDALEAGGATTFSEIVQTAEGLQQVLRALGKTDERTREIAALLVEYLVGGSVDAVRTSARDALDQWKRSVRGLAGDTARRLQAKVTPERPDR